MYHAVKGGGAFENGKLIKVGNRTPENAYMVLETKLEKPNNLELYQKLRQKSCMVNMVCSGYEHAMVAKGQLDARICVDGYGQDYDFAPGSLLIQEAGGVVTNIGSDQYDYRNTNYIAANRAIHDALSEGEDAILRSAGNNNIA
jgi:fructose-1,6-bisphosphatase/inositol monophosphatase family enzyme